LPLVAIDRAAGSGLKLGDLVTIGLAAGVYALLALTFVLVWMEALTTLTTLSRSL
jgi:hypothetical protein